MSNAGVFIVQQNVVVVQIKDVGSAEGVAQSPIKYFIRKKYAKVVVFLYITIPSIFTCVIKGTAGTYTTYHV